MKKLGHFLLIALVVLGLAGTLWMGIRKQREKPAAEEAAAGEKKEDEDKPEDFVVKLEKEKAEALDLEKEEPQKTEVSPHRVAFGRILDPTPLVTLDGDLAAADAALAASRAEYERTQKLLAAGENTSRKNAETAEAQFRADEIKAESLRSAARLTWGTAFSTSDAKERRDFIHRLVEATTVLARVDVLPGDALSDLPRAARVQILGREDQSIETKSVVPAADVEVKAQAQGFILRIDEPPFPLRPGMALTAWLELAQPARTGFILPRSAVLRHDGRTWVYVQEEEERYVRKPVKLDTLLPGDKGWFVNADGGLKADDLLVVSGAQALLSEELKAQGGGDAD